MNETPQTRESGQDGSGAGRVVFKARGARKTLTRTGERFELEIPDIELVAGRVTGVVGESGAGKSTLLDLLALISSPDSADELTLDLGEGDGAGGPQDLQALWRGRDERSLAGLRRRVGLVLQDGGLLSFLNVAGNAALAQRLGARRSDRARIAKLAEELGVADRLSSYPATLSGGERQRAAILRALAHEPALLVADEPTAAVDRLRALAIMRELAAQARHGGAACVIVSHDMSLIESVADQVYRIEVERGGEDGLTRAVCRLADAPSPGAASAELAQRSSDAEGEEAAAAPVAEPSQALDPSAALASVRRDRGRHWLPLRLAATDLRRDARFSFASIAAVAAVIAPLLLLLGLKQGVVEHQVVRLVQDPRSRELTPLRAVALTPQTLQEWRERPEIAFVAPGVARGASGVVARVEHPNPRLRQERLMDLLATEGGDPLLSENGSPPPKGAQAALSHSAAVSLARGEDPSAMVGRKIDLLVSRRSDGRRESRTVEMTVVGVLDPRADPLERIYAPFEFVASVEAYRASRRADLSLGESDEATALETASTPKREPNAAPASASDETLYRGFRIYARSIYDVERVHRGLAEEGIEAAARLGPIRAVREADNALTLLLALVGAIGLGSAFAAMAANLVSMVERKRAEIGLLRMMGLSRRGAFVLPMLSAVMIAGAASLLACGVYLLAAAPINLALAQALPFGDNITRLYPAEMAVSVLIACAAAATCAVFAARRAARVDPATALRRE